MYNIGISTMRLIGPLALLSAYFIGTKKIDTPSDLFYYAIMTANVMVIAFWIFDEINNFKNKKSKK
ncbi:hypothetical protein FG426_002025 [Yersinia enterocolitica]|uniref:hypothetical protein n=1 Tax=Yersinia enterocolitica TaxID=630 RepID=UPI0028B87789|nr:hypothetical protein [Yersinia enterocolitica]EKN4742201.1 hypothetical protein [Yersinia enterocolitica]EKN4838712.1 hypothetical protein [Yersinia enterocolitica]EKN6270815.1 hypothetical protein [Yersinia enterocolitica]ELI8163024.1 hypothetical protein [Yersinia enterocolitica]